MEGFWGLNGRFLVAKILSKIDVFLARFSDASGNIDGTARGRRGSREEAAGVAATVALSPADAPGRRHSSKILY